MTNTYGKNLKAFTVNPLSVKAFLMSSSLTVAGMLLKCNVAEGG